MASTSPIQSPRRGQETPSIPTAALLIIRKEIEPQAGFWQFRFRPWHYWVSFGSSAVIATAFVVLLALGGHR